MSEKLVTQQSLSKHDQANYLLDSLNETHPVKVFDFGVQEKISIGSRYATADIIIYDFRYVFLQTKPSEGLYV